MDALGDARTENREINYVTDPVGMLFRRLLPSAIGSLLNATVASLIDVVILSYFLGPSMLAVVELCMPVYMLVNTLAMLISSGAATLYAHSLGEGDREEALRWFSASTIHMLICGGVLMLAGFLFAGPAFFRRLSPDSTAIRRQRQSMFKISRKPVSEKTLRSVSFTPTAWMLPPRSSIFCA